VLSHAAGLFSLILTASASTGTALDLVGGQSARIHSGLVGGAPVVWAYSGSGSAFLVGAGAILEIADIVVAAAAGLAFRLAAGATLTGTPQLQSGAISCSALAAGIGSSALDCATDAGSITLAGPTFVSTSGSAMPLGSVKYLGEVLTDFTDALYTREVGLYTLDVSTDVRTATAIPVESSMHVTISGDASKPAWMYTGKGSAFTVAAAAYLTINSMTVDASGFEVAAGGSISFSGSELSGSLSVGGSLSMSDCDVTSDGDSVPLTIEAGGAATVIATTFQSTQGDGTFEVVSVARGGSLSAADCTIVVAGGHAIPFPCDAGDGVAPDCSGPHTGAVAVDGPAGVSAAWPLICMQGAHTFSFCVALPSY
jgi:hypothetical protein